MTITTTLDAQGVDSVDAQPNEAKARRRHELGAIHRRAGQLVAELSEGPAWANADHITTRLIVEAELFTTVATSADGGAPAIVRCRELAVAQRRLVSALEADHRLDVGEAAIVRARALVAELAEVAAGCRATLPR